MPGRDGASARENAIAVALHFIFQPCSCFSAIRTSGSLTAVHGRALFSAGDGGAKRGSTDRIWPYELWKALGLGVYFYGLRLIKLGLNVTF